MENYFGIHIPDRIAENIFTVRESVNVISEILHVTDENFHLRDEIFRKIKLAFHESGYSHIDVNYNDLLIDFIPENDLNVWKSLAKKLDLEVPEPLYGRKSIKGSSGLLSIFSAQPDYHYSKITFEQFTEVVCAANHLKLIDREKIKSIAEIYYAVMAITVDKCGIDFYEIHPDKSFTDDFGID